jgi:alginate O-acetyltransferase complex protein AlgJ
MNQNLDLIPEEVTWATFLKGDVSSGIANALAKAPVPDNAAQFERGFSWLVTRDLGPRVREGSDDWLFLNDELVVHQDRLKNAADRSQQIYQIEQQLSSRGINLLVILVPDKSRTVPEFLGAQRRATFFESRVNDFANALTQQGVDVINLSKVLSVAKQNGVVPFLRTDSHWTEQGAQEAAKAIAQKIQSLKINPSPAQLTQITKQSQETRLGDLVKLAGVDWLPQSLQPKPEKAQRSDFLSKPIESHRKSLDALNDLFGDDNLPNIALIGTSFSRTSQFVPFLEV